jgi:prepilin-type processing-associated H-X9-DG protein
MSLNADSDPDPNNPYIERPVHAPEPRPRRRFRIVNVLVALGIILVLILLLLPNVRSAGGAARRSQCQNNLRNIALALQGYANAHNALPPAYTVGADGRPLHSWRTLILPYLDEQELYKTIDLSKPWDDPVNSTAFHTRLAIYLCPSAQSARSRNETPYLAVVGPNACFLPRAPRPLKDITDRHAATLMVVEADEAHAVPWMAPSDASDSLVMGLGPDTTFHHPGGTNAAFVDGHISFLFSNMSPEIRRMLISIAGNDEITQDEF